MILLSSDVTLSGQQVVETYAKRFKIEVTFRMFVLLLGGFAYRFWLKALDKLPTWPQSMRLADYEDTLQAQILAKVETFERFVNLNAIALGVLQILAIEMPELIWKHFPAWFRSFPDHGYPSERVVRMTLQNLQDTVLSESREDLLLDKLLAQKTPIAKPTDKQPIAA